VVRGRKIRPVKISRQKRNDFPSDQYAMASKRRDHHQAAEARCARLSHPADFFACGVGFAQGVTSICGGRSLSHVYMGEGWGEGECSSFDKRPSPNPLPRVRGRGLLPYRHNEAPHSSLMRFGSKLTSGAQCLKCLCPVTIITAPAWLTTSRDS
jgi:hypothetical protein